ncbi:isochorismatase hydrolase [Denitrovibrio acetiphilus DSM 12809]|uniref:Isochorismatase hydrolase n=1 Tax=Denitrovibrio acetiphilus (strain DSM 12809 / NBRC 114555 / N2460) TaxID=522772 RepID=D4H4E0_DENA2|nr:isochorismatase family protein [Denitrovibrio acetiphilus]ADD69269.1 isochorismatase hydrolase [Denitrovibrio acetiphilus DSM 12809]
MKKTILSFLLAAATSFTSYAGNIIEEWSSSISPSAPKLFEVNISASETAMLIIDIEEQRPERNRRSKNNGKTASINHLKNKAEEAGMTVIYTVIPSYSEQKALTSAKNSSDNIFNELQDILSKNNIKNIIIAGASDNATVLHTATAAAYTGYSVIAPIDCLTGAEEYTEQATIWNLDSGNRKNETVTLTKSNMITITA